MVPQESLCAELARQIVDGRVSPRSPRSEDAGEEAIMLADIFQGLNDRDLLTLCSEASERYVLNKQEPEKTLLL